MNFSYREDDRAIDHERALEQACGEVEFLAELLTDFTAEKDETINKLKRAAKANDHTAIRNEGHALKGTALNLALTALGHLGADVEQCGKLGEEGDLSAEDSTKRDELIERLEPEFARVQEHLKTIE